ncbi:hypothetical protein [Paracoccus sp. NSM]|uniref:hypothetical protein n=1 Tax=Paracoccus sp. NSM TaxID=3457784 RepID=UPI00403585C0
MRLSIAARLGTVGLREAERDGPAALVFRDPLAQPCHFAGQVLDGQGRCAILHLRLQAFIKGGDSFGDQAQIAHLVQQPRLCKAPDIRPGLDQFDGGLEMLARAVALIEAQGHAPEGIAQR